MSVDVYRKILLALKGDKKLTEWAEGWLTYQIKKDDRHQIIKKLKREWLDQYVRKVVKLKYPEWEWDQSGFADNVANDLDERFYLVWEERRQMVEDPGGDRSPLNANEMIELVNYVNDQIPDEYRFLEHQTDDKFKSVTAGHKGRGEKFGWKTK